MICILSLVTFVTPVHAAVGDLILDSEIFFHDPDFYNAENAKKSSTLLKEGYSISLDRMWWLETSPGQEICVTNYSIFKNGNVVTRISVNESDYFYYYKTIDGREYRIIESKVDAIIVGGAGLNFVKLRPVRQYSDGSVISEPDFITASLNPYIKMILLLKNGTGHSGEYMMTLGAMGSLYSRPVMGGWQALFD